ncbi:MAG TPA: methionine biosynthesis protein MetW, partial [bacterium]|nr:methionine biosynthesis protein MetW [bacterium]
MLSESRREKILENSEKLIIDYIKPNSRVLDLGCGEGALLEKLQAGKNVRAVGIEIDEKNVLTCISKGLSVCQGNIDEGLTDYADKSFDYIIINNTLQQIFKPEYVINEMRRVGKIIIIGMASFTFWKIRLSLLFHGKLPKTAFYQYEWYNTPNIR